MGWRDAPLAEPEAQPAWMAAPLVRSPLANDDPVPQKGIGAVIQQGRFSESTEQTAERAGIGTEGVGIGARFNLNLGLTGDEKPDDEAEIAKRAISRSLGVPVETRMGPDTGRLEFRPEGGEQWGLVNAPGADWGDLGAIAPEAATLGTGAAAGMAGGIAGGTLGTGAGGPGVGTFVGALAGTAAGEAAGEGIALGSRLLLARERGLIDMTDDQIFDASFERAQNAALTAGAAGLAVSAFRGVWKRFRGASAVGEVINDPKAVREGVEGVKGVQRDVEALSGKPFPVTPGQAMNDGGILAGEQAALQTKRTSNAIQQVRDQQQDAIDAIGDGIPGAGADVARSGRELQSVVKEKERKAIRPASERKDRAQIAAEQAEGEILRQSRDPASAVGAMRSNIEDSRERVFAPFHDQFEEIQQNTLVNVDLAPFSDAIKKAVNKDGQSVLPSISLQNQSTLMREAGESAENPRTLGEVQRALRDIRRELRKQGGNAEPQRQRMLTQLKFDLESARDSALIKADPPGKMLTEVRQLEAAYRESIERFDQGIIGRYMQDDRFGVPRMSGDDVAFNLMRSKEDIAALIEATSQMPGGKAILADAQDAVLGLIERRSLDNGGSINAGRLKLLLQTNREALEELFASRPNILRTLRSVEQFKAAVKKHSATMDKTKQLFERRFGFASADPTVIVRNLIKDGNAGQFGLARRLLERNRPERVPAFKEAVASELRDQMTSGGKVTVKSIDGFLNSRSRAIAEQALGPKYIKDLRTWRNAMEIAERKAGPTAPKDLARLFDRGVPALEGLARVGRAAMFAPLSKIGRTVTALIGLSREQIQNRLSDALADPVKLEKLAKLARVSPRSIAARTIYADLGFEALGVLADNREVILHVIPSISDATTPSE